MLGRVEVVFSEGEKGKRCVGVDGGRMCWEVLRVCLVRRKGEECVEVDGRGVCWGELRLCLVRREGEEVCWGELGCV